jgi:general secretion pathway protein J
MKRNGFTLIEMMVSLFIFGLLATAAVSLMGFSVRAQAAAVRRLDMMAGERRMTALLAADFAQIVPRISRDVDGKPVRAFTGLSGAAPGVIMRYVRAGRSDAGGAGRSALERVDLIIDQGRLQRQSYPMVDGTRAGTPTLLADAVESITVRYRAPEGWVAQWDDPRFAALPGAVELTITQRGKPAILSAFLIGGAIR